MGEIIYVDVKCILNIFVNKPLRLLDPHEYNYPSKKCTNKEQFGAKDVMFPL